MTVTGLQRKVLIALAELGYEMLEAWVPWYWLCRRLVRTEAVSAKQLSILTLNALEVRGLVATRLCEKDDQSRWKTEVRLTEEGRKELMR